MWSAIWENIVSHDWLWILYMVIRVQRYTYSRSVRMVRRRSANVNENLHALSLNGKRKFFFSTASSSNGRTGQFVICKRNQTPQAITKDLQ